MMRQLASGRRCLVGGQRLAPQACAVCAVLCCFDFHAPALPEGLSAFYTAARLSSSPTPREGEVGAGWQKQGAAKALCPTPAGKTDLPQHPGGPLLFLQNTLLYQDRTRGTISISALWWLSDSIFGLGRKRHRFALRIYHALGLPACLAALASSCAGAGTPSALACCPGLPRACTIARRLCVVFPGRRCAACG